MAAIWTIALKDLALRFRDRSVIIIGLVAPLALAFIFNLVFGGSLNDVGEQVTLSMGVVDLDDGPVGGALVELLSTLEDDGLIELQTYTSLEQGTSAADDGEVGAVFHIPAGLSASVVGGSDALIEVIGNVDAPTTTDIATSIASQFASGVQRANLAAVTALGSGVIDASQMMGAAAAAGAAAPLVQVGQIETEVRQLDSATYFVAGLSIFFIFFVAGLSVTDMLEERREGTLARLMAAPISPGSITIGKSLTSVIIGIVSMTVLVGASTLLMGADWGPAAGVALLVVPAILAVVAIMTLVGGLARTPEQAGNLQSIVAVTFAMLGGTFVPITEGDGLLARLQYLTPNGWFMHGLAEMAPGDVAAVLPSAGMLLIMALVAGTAGLLLVRKVVHL